MQRIHPRTQKSQTNGVQLTYFSRPQSTFITSKGDTGHSFPHSQHKVSQHMSLYVSLFWTLMQVESHGLFWCLHLSLNSNFKVRLSCWTSLIVDRLNISNNTLGNEFLYKQIHSIMAPSENIRAEPRMSPPNYLATAFQLSPAKPISLHQNFNNARIFLRVWVHHSGSWAHCGR